MHSAVRIAVVTSGSLGGTYGFICDACVELFICGGAFVGLSDIVNNRIAEKSSIGFSNSHANLEQNEGCEPLPDDLYKFGMIPEFVGRLPILCALHTLQAEDLRRILVEPKNSIIGQYKKLFKIEGIDLKFTNGAVECIAQKAIENKTGARGLRSIVEKALRLLMYRLPSDKTIQRVTIDADYIGGTGEVKIKRKEPQVEKAL